MNIVITLSLLCLCHAYQIVIVNGTESATKTTDLVVDPRTIAPSFVFDSSVTIGRGISVSENTAYSGCPYGYNDCYMDTLFGKSEVQDQILSNYIRIRDSIFSGEAQEIQELLKLFTDDIEYKLTWNNNITYHGKEEVSKYIESNYQEYVDINQCKTIQGEPSFHDFTMQSFRVKFTVVRYHHSPIADAKKLWKMRLVETEFHLVRSKGRQWLIQKVNILTSKEVKTHFYDFFLY